MFLVQTLVHKFETASRAGPFKALLVLLAAVLLGLGYDLRNYKNLSAQEAMDSAQLARNLAEGKGFTTQFIRPFSLYLLKRAVSGSTFTNNAAGSMFKDAVPDISNPPVYPGVLAGLMKIAPFRFNIASEQVKTKPFWGDLGDFRRYEPDFVIAAFNQILMLSVIWLVFLWARRFFDPAVAWTSAALLLFTEVLWRFSVSGLSTMLLMLIFMTLVWSLTLLESETREPKWGKPGVAILSVLTGIVLGIGGMTRYSFSWLLVPALLFIGATTGPRRTIYCLSAALAFAVVMAPWLFRNQLLSGTPFGTCSYSLLEQSVQFPGNQLQRSMDPNTFTMPSVLWQKLFDNLHTLRQKNLFNLGTGWGVALFLTGLLIGFRSNTLRWIRYFLLFCLPFLVVIQAAGRTQLSEESPEINSENLLVLLLPMIVVYAVSFFLILLQQLRLPIIERRLVAGAFFGVAVSPMILSLLKSEPSPLSYPPYHPAVIQQVSAWMKSDELIMSDIPWAVAWYGNRQCLWLTLNAAPAADNAIATENPLTISARFKPVSALYLTPQTIDARLLSECIRGRENSWARFVLRCLAFKEVPDNFPLHEMPRGFLPEQIFLADAKRWHSDASLLDSAPAVPSELPPKEQHSK